MKIDSQLKTILKQINTKSGGNVKAKGPKMLAIDLIQTIEKKNKEERDFQKMMN